ncbi:MAG: hypothetical protein EXR59_05845, partial [Dehalococcoidia bacterium]|nr:hypothetical protein [Dehalococcoidia bacterium]
MRINKGISEDRSKPLSLGAGWGHREPMSIVQLIEASDVSAEVASLLWLVMSYRVSAISAAMPQMSGKSTMMNCLRDFIRPDEKLYYLQGRFEDFTFLPSTKPANSVLIAEELSDHTPSYVWGEGAQHLFSLLPDGYRMLSTMHASTAEELLGGLSEWLGIPIEQLEHVGMIVNLAAGRRPPNVPLREGIAAEDRLYRLTMVSLIRRPKGDDQSLMIEPLAEWVMDKDEHTVNENALNILS